MTALAGRHAVVTGASRGIGAAIANHLERAGATLTRIARHGDDSILGCDVTAPEQVAAAMTYAEMRHGPIHILVNNAGMGRSAPFLNTDAAMLDEMHDVNLKGAWHCSQRVLPGMLAARWGRILNVASLAGLEGFPYISAYCTSKHALIGLTRALAAEFDQGNIAFAAVCPGYTETDMLGESIANITARTGLSREQARARLAALNPQGRILSPAEVAAAVLQLCIARPDLVNGRIVSLPDLPPP